jgi:L-threonine kinase
MENNDMKVTVKAPGSCGELAQGTINGKNFLITCPIDVYSTVTVTRGEYIPLRVVSKVYAAINKTLYYCKQTSSSLHVQVQSDLPLGKGMASSSADISATCQSVALSIGMELTPDEIADIALSIEPTDGIFYPGIILFDHVHGKIRKPLGEAIPMHIVIVDVGGEINTLHFNKRQDLQKLNINNEYQLDQAVRLITKGLHTKDIRLIGKGATISARANQNILFKPHLEKIIAIGHTWGAVGVNIAHSGTVVGILFPMDSKVNHGPCIEEIHRSCPGVTYLRTVQFISGGLRKRR